MELHAAEARAVTARKNTLAIAQTPPGGSAAHIEPKRERRAVAMHLPNRHACRVCTLSASVPTGMERKRTCGKKCR